MKKILVMTTVVAAAFAGAGAVAVSASSTNDPPAQAGRALGGTNTKYARLSVFVNNSGQVVRSKGVAAVTRPSTGQYCIDPAATFDVAKIVPSVSVDWSTSLGSDLSAYWRSSGGGCPAGNISVVTYVPVSGTPTLSNNVGFMLVVP